MRVVVDDKISALLLQAGSTRNKKITSFNLIRLRLQKQISLEMFIPASTEYFIVKSEKEMDLASAIAMNFVCKKFFLYFSGLNRVLDPLNPSLVTPASIVPIRIRHW